jgi:hypothetical protein
MSVHSVRRTQMRIASASCAVAAPRMRWPCHDSSRFQVGKLAPFREEEEMRGDEWEMGRQSRGVREGGGCSHAAAKTCSRSSPFHSRARRAPQEAAARGEEGREFGKAGEVWWWNLVQGSWHCFYRRVSASSLNSQMSSSPQPPCRRPPRGPPAHTRPSCSPVAVPPLAASSPKSIFFLFLISGFKGGCPFIESKNPKVMAGGGRGAVGEGKGWTARSGCLSRTG